MSKLQVENHLKVLDLFAGAGGLSNGFEQTGKFKVKIAVEINENAIKTYKLNHPGISVHRDITKLKYKNEHGIISDEFSDIDVVIGGPPCQGFSNANRQQNTLISSNNQLVKEFLRAIENIRPKAFVMENVRTMESEKHKFFMNENDINELENLNIQPKKEKIKIGRCICYSERLEDFLKTAYNAQMDLKPFLISKELLSKLNTLLKYTKRSPGDLLKFVKNEKNKKFYLKFINQWEETHKKYWDESYRKDWLKLGLSLKNMLNENPTLIGLECNLEDIIETQKIINKIFEVIENKVILINININDPDFEITIKSFNVFNFIKRKLSYLGYKFNEDKYIFNAAEYGVAQERKRLILMGVRDDSLVTEAVVPPAPLFTKKDDYYKIYDALGDLANLPPSTDVKEDVMERDLHPPIIGSWLNQYLNNNTNQKIYNHVRTDSREVALKRFASLKAGQNFHDLDESLKITYTDHSRTQNTIYKRLSYEKASDTVLNARKSMWIHPEKDRAISIREAARLQSFRDSYKFCGSKDSQYQQIGNAVPPLLARAIAEGLLKSLGVALDFTTRDILLSNKKDKKVEIKF